MVDARIPARISPARIAAITPCLLRRSAIRTIIVSDAEPSRRSNSPAAVIPSPTTPISTATASEITTHVVATLLESVSFSSSSIAMKRRRICGIPKYPSPHASMEIILSSGYACSVPVVGSYVVNIVRYPGRDLAWSATASIPPAVLIPNTNTITSAMDMMILWIKSVVEAARNPPSVVYPTMTSALMIIAGRYFTPKRLAKSLPQAANPEAVYGIKKITIKIAPIDCRIFFSSL